MSEVTREMISAAHKVTMQHSDLVLSHSLLERIYLAMDALANHKKTLGSPFHCTVCGGALPTTGRTDATGECVCGEPSAPGIVHRKDGPCYHAEPVAWMDPNSGEVCRAHWLESHAPERDVDRFTCALYTALPQRKPLTEAQIYAAIKGIDSLKAVEVARAIEKAHGIGGSNE